MKITRDDIIGPTGLGFQQTLYSAIAATEEQFKTLVDAVITEQAGELLERIGSTAYNDATKLTYVKKAEKCLAAAELLQRRLNIMFANAQASGNETTIDSRERLQRNDYLAQAEVQIAKIAQGVTTDPTASFVSGALVTSHFE